MWWDWVLTRTGERLHTHADTRSYSTHIFILTVALVKFHHSKGSTCSSGHIHLTSFMMAFSSVFKSIHLFLTLTGCYMFSETKYITRVREFLIIHHSWPPSSYAPYCHDPMQLHQPLCSVLLEFYATACFQTCDMRRGRRKNMVTKGRCVYKTKIESKKGVGSGRKKGGILGRKE